MRILHIVDGLGAKAAGVGSVARQLILAQQALGMSVGCVTSDGQLPDNMPQLPQAKGPLPYRIWRAIRSADVVHVHALWLWSTAIAGHACMLQRKPYVISPHGMLDSWALRQSRLKKAIARRLAENRILSGAVVIHVLCRSEADSVRSLGFRNPLALVPPGVEARGGFAGSHMQTRDPVVLFLGRIHPKKGVDLLLSAFSRVASGRNGTWRLVIAGPDQVGLRASLEARARQPGLKDRVEFVGPVYDSAKEALLQSAAVFVLPSQSEGVPVAAIEAMASGMPVLLSRACNLPEVEEAGAGFVGEAEAGSVADLLERFMALGDVERAAMGNRARQLARARFDIRESALKHAEVYRWALGLTDRPPAVLVTRGP